MELFQESSEEKSTGSSAGIGRRGASSKGRPSRSRKTGKSPGTRNRKLSRSRGRTRRAGPVRDGRRAESSREEVPPPPADALLDGPESGLSDPEEPRKEPPPSAQTTFNLSMGGDHDDLVEYVY